MELRHPPLTEARWRTSSYSGASSQTCVEVAPLGDRVGVRDTKDRTRGTHLITAPTWHTFLDAVKHGRL